MFRQHFLHYVRSLIFMRPNRILEYSIEWKPKHRLKCKFNYLELIAGGRRHQRWQSIHTREIFNVNSSVKYVNSNGFRNDALLNVERGWDEILLQYKKIHEIQ
jgi:hypothetical protein